VGLVVDWNENFIDASFFISKAHNNRKIMILIYNSLKPKCLKIEVSYINEKMSDG
jgi:hypothetical protein